MAVNDTETYVILLDMGTGANFKRDVLGARPDKDSAAAAIKTYVEIQNRELRQIWGPSSNAHMERRLLKIRPDGLGALNGFKDAHVWATQMRYDEELG